MTTYIQTQDEGNWVLVEKPPRQIPNRLEVGVFTEFTSPIDGKRIASRSRQAAHDRHHNVIQSGTEDLGKIAGNVRRRQARESERALDRAIQTALRA